MSYLNVTTREKNRLRTFGYLLSLEEMIPFASCVILLIKYSREGTRGLIFVIKGKGYLST